MVGVGARVRLVGWDRGRMGKEGLLGDGVLGWVMGDERDGLQLPVTVYYDGGAGC